MPLPHDPVVPVQIIAEFHDACEAVPDLSPEVMLAHRAFWRDLPALLADPRLHGRWVCYVGGEQVGVAVTELELLDRCARRGIAEDDAHTYRIRPRDLAPWEVEDVEGSHEEDAAT